MDFKATQDENILNILLKISPNSSKNTLRSWIKEGRVEVDGVPIKNSSVQVLKGQSISVGQKKKIVRSGVPILYEDSDLVIIDKPSGLLSVAAAYEKGETAFALLKAHYYPKKVYVVHRLDQDTSGVMVFALSQEACNQLKSLFEIHDIERAYTAVVEGAIQVEKGMWKSYQFEDKQYVVHETEDSEKGKLAITHFKKIKSSKKCSLLELKLETGRKNQIRVHCQSAGHPVVGDKKYGAQTNPLKRLCLHAHLLAFKHPFSKKECRFESKIPEKFLTLCGLAQ